MKRTINEKGQSLVIIAFAFFGLVAIAALAIDGGVLYLNRRNAQTAADAAAMAGAHELCVNNGSISDVENVVNNYAITENGATAVDDIAIDEDNLSVTVITRIETTSFFAQLIGFENNTARAEASAGCFPPASGQYVLPISWACQPPAGTTGTSVEKCVIHSIPWDLFTQNYPAYKDRLGETGGGITPLILDAGDENAFSTYMDGAGEKMPYLIMDSSGPTTAMCAPPIGTTVGGVICDFNGDGIAELSGGGDRGWLELDAKGASGLSDLIVNGFPGIITVPQWFPYKTGVTASVFDKAKGLVEGKTAFVPVYNAYCLSTDGAGIPTNCPDKSNQTPPVPGYVSSPPDLISVDTGSNTYFRIASFAPFIVTCVSSKPNQKCPVKSFVNLDKNVRTIEGYFFSGYTGGNSIDPDGFYLGVYIVSLIK